MITKIKIGLYSTDNYVFFFFILVLNSLQYLSTYFVRPQLRSQNHTLCIQNCFTVVQVFLNNFEYLFTEYISQMVFVDSNS